MSTISNAVWELQIDVVTAAAELVAGLDLDRMAQVTTVAMTAPPSLGATTIRAAVRHAPLNDQLALVAAAINFRQTLEALLEGRISQGALSARKDQDGHQ